MAKSNCCNNKSREIYQMKITKLLATIIILAISILSCGSGNEEKSELDKYIKDEALKNCILREMFEALNHNYDIPLDISHPFYEKSMTTIFCSVSEDGVIESLEGISRLYWIKVINMQDNKISDLSPLENLHKLERIHLGENRIESIKPLMNLTNLKNISVGFNRIKDPSPVKWCLESEDCTVYIQHNCIKDNLGGLIDNTTLAYQDYTRCGDYDLDEPVTIKDENLRKCLLDRDFTRYTAKNITQIDCEGILGRIKDLYGLEHFTGMGQLIIEGSEISDLSPLSGLKQLIYLKIRIGNISDLSPLSELTGIYWLDLSVNPLKNLDGLENLRHLKYFWAEYSELESIDALSGIKSLSSLYLSNNLIEDISPLSEASNMQIFKIYENKIKDLEPLRDKIRLKKLLLSSNLIDDFEPLSGLINLEQLYIDNNCTTDISPLSEIKDEIETLYHGTINPECNNE